MPDTFVKFALNQESQALKYLDVNFFTCTAKQASECTGRGFLVGKAQATCSPCLNWIKRQEEDTLERANYWFVEGSK